MKLHLTREQMLEEWKARTLLHNLRADCSVEPSGAFDIDLYAEKAMRSWYMMLLATAPAEYLAPVDLSQQASVYFYPGRIAEVTLPANVVRVVSVMCAGWTHSAEIVTDLSSPLAAAQRNPYTKGGPAHPVALITGPNTMRVYSVVNTAFHPIFKQLWCIVEPDEGYYDLDERALNLIPNPFNPKSKP